MGGTFQTSNIKHESSASNNITLTSDGKTTFGNDIVLGSGKGIVFDGTVGGTVTSKTLDDYEEGTWIPTLGSSGGAATGQTYSYQYAKYVKIGGLVYFDAYVALTNLGSLGTNNYFVVKGLPFTSMGGNQYFSVSVSYFVGLGTALSSMSGYTSGGAEIYITGQGSPGTSMTALQPASSFLTNTTGIMVSGCYLAS